MKKTRKRDAERAAKVKMTARIMRVSDREIERVIVGERKNETAMSVFMTIQEVNQDLENELIKAVRKAVPFD